MTEIQKEQNHEMRRNGCTYRYIVDALSLKEETVKTYRVRVAKKGLLSLANPIEESSSKQCGIHVEQVPRCKRKTFC